MQTYNVFYLVVVMKKIKIYPTLLH